MHILLTDETNLEARDNIEFFAYGGLIVPTDKVPALHQSIERIRVAAGYKADDRLKFETKARPAHVSIEAAKKAKQEVVAACIEHECKFIAYVVLHAIAQKQSTETNVQWGANSVIAKFNSFLEQEKSHGIVAMDRLPKGVEFEYLAKKFTTGLELPNNEVAPLNRIALFSSTCINASHLSSAMDIVLGSWRYCINQPQNVAAAKEMMNEIVKLMWHERVGETIYALEKGLLLRPQDVRRADYKQKYDELLAHVNVLIKD